MLGGVKPRASRWVAFGIHFALWSPQLVLVQADIERVPSILEGSEAWRLIEVFKLKLYLLGGSNLVALLILSYVQNPVKLRYLNPGPWFLPAVLLRHQGQTEGRLHVRALRQRGPPSLELAGLHVALLRHRLLHPQPLVPGQVRTEKTQPGLVQRVAQVQTDRAEFYGCRLFVKKSDHSFVDPDRFKLESDPNLIQDFFVTNCWEARADVKKRNQAIPAPKEVSFWTATGASTRQIRFCNRQPLVLGACFFSHRFLRKIPFSRLSRLAILPPSSSFNHSLFCIPIFYNPRFTVKEAFLLI